MSECNLTYLQITSEQASRLRQIVWEYITDLHNKDENLRYVREIMKLYLAIGGKND